VCGCLKDFLRSLKEPLVTYKLWKDFAAAAENRDKAMAESDTYQVLGRLPQANRDTIAFVMLHLLRVSQTPECKMPVNNLCRVFGPTIIGHSTPDPEPMQLVNETKYHALVMDQLFNIPEEYWVNFISDDAEEMYPNVNTPQTPEVTRTVHESRLGPVHTPGSYDRSRTWNTRTTYTPSRFAERTTNISRKPSHFFSSPTVD